MVTPDCQKIETCFPLKSSNIVDNLVLLLYCDSMETVL